MSFLMLLVFASGLAWLAGRVLGVHLTTRDAMRVGMGMAFLFTGVDHFANANSRYVPMMPAALAEHALIWVYVTGAAELAGAVGLLTPSVVYRRIGLPNLQRWAGVGLAVLLACVVWANISVALRGQTVQGLEFGAWYYWVRPLFQPLFIWWALYCVAVLRSRVFNPHDREHGPRSSRYSWQKKPPQAWR